MGNISLQSVKLCLINRTAKDLLRKLCHPDPAYRYTASEALKHPWIYTYNIA